MAITRLEPLFRFPPAGCQKIVRHNTRQQDLKLVVLIQQTASQAVSPLPPPPSECRPRVTQLGAFYFCQQRQSLVELGGQSAVAKVGVLHFARKQLHFPQEPSALASELLALLHAHYLIA